MVNTKESKLVKSISEKLKEFPQALSVFNKLLKDEESNTLQDNANRVAIKRLGFSDHGRIHALIVIDSAIKLLKLLGCKTTLVNEHSGSIDDSVTAVVLAGYLHDIGMNINRTNHELFSTILARPIIERILDGLANKYIINATASEALMCHMANYKPTCVESGVVTIADGTDMTSGRERLPHTLGTYTKGDLIHCYSKLSILHVEVKEGTETRPIKITVTMTNESGIFQIGDTLMTKLKNSGLADKVQVEAIVKGNKKNELIKIN